MKIKSSITIVLLFTAIVSNAQGPNKYFIKANRFIPNTIDYDVPTELESEAIGYRIIAKDSTDALLYNVKDYYLSGKIKMIGKSRTLLPYLSLDGPCISFYENGNKKFEGNYKLGLTTGELTKYYPNGALYLKGDFDQKRKLHVIECHDSTGKVLVENGKGKWIKYSDDFKLKTGVGDVEDGIEIGEWKGNINAVTTYTCNYVDGRVKSGKSIGKDGKEHLFTEEFALAGFETGIQEFYNYLGKTLRYPGIARERNVQGKVFVTFTVEVDGTLSDVKIVRGIGSGCDEETVRVIKASSGSWKPAQYLGLPVASLYTVPVSFTLASRW